MNNYCINCGKKLKTPKAQRCQSCARKRILKENPTLNINYKYPRGFWFNKKRKHSKKCKCPFCQARTGNFIPWNKNKKLSKTHKKNISKSHIGKKLSTKTKKLMSEAQKKLWSNPKYKMKLSKERKNRYKDINYKTGWLKKMLFFLKIKPNNKEFLLFKILKTLKLKKYQYVGDGKFLLGGFNPDFINIKDKKIIELYGDYWHNLENSKKRDKRRLKIYTRLGYQTLIIWEHELKDLDFVVGKLIGFQKNKS